MAEVGGCGKDTTNSKYTLQGVPENTVRDIFSGTSGISVLDCDLRETHCTIEIIELWSVAKTDNWWNEIFLDKIKHFI